MVEEFSFVVINDLHYTSAECRPWLQGVMRRINSMPGIELVLVLGDLAETGSREELTVARDILNELSAPYYPVPGNHDGPPGRPVGAGAMGLETYESLFPGRRNYTFTHRGWQFLALDTTNGSGYQQLPIPGETRAFARHAAGTLNPALPTILFTHMPLEPTVRFSSADGYALLDDLRTLNLRIVFSGHFHGRTCHIAPGRPHLQLLTNSCCARTRELHDGSARRGFSQGRANADGSVSLQFMEYAGAKP